MSIKNRTLLFLNPILFILISLIIILSSSCGNRGKEDKTYSANDSLHGKISISGAFALYPLAVKWAEEYHKINKGVTIDVQAGGAGKGLTDALSGTVDAGMVSRSISEEEIAKGTFPVCVAKDAVVATMSAQNPYLNDILKLGISKEQFRKIWIEGSVKTWGDLLANNSKEKIRVFTRSDAAGAPETWAKYLGAKQEDLLGVGVFGDPGVAQSVENDKFSIGFNNVNYVYDMTTKKPFEGLLPVPIDVNSNGVVDADEKFYSAIDTLNNAIVQEQYPSPPARELFFVFKAGHFNAVTNKFTKWILNDGQQYAAPSGYVKLSDEILFREKEKLK